MDVSVIICSYNRASSLINTLKSLEALECQPGISWELIVVDNNSTDETRAIVAEFVNQGTLPLKYVFEKKQGLSYARNAGIKQAAGNILAFTDDDCIVDRHWLAAISHEFDSDASLSGIGGRVELYNINDAPVSIRPFRERIPFLSLAQLFYLIQGCNMAFRSEVFEKVGGFDPSFGSNNGLVADDTDFVFRAYRKGLKMVFVPEVLVYHNHGRRTPAQLQALFKSYVNGRGGFYCKHILRGDHEVLKMAYWEVRPLVRDVVRQLVAGKLTSNDLSCLWNLVRGAARRLWEEVRNARFKGLLEEPRVEPRF